MIEPAVVSDSDPELECVRLLDTFARSLEVEAYGPSIAARGEYEPQKTWPPSAGTVTRWRGVAAAVIVTALVGLVVAAGGSSGPSRSVAPITTPTETTLPSR
jgi:hypothetical protein